ncbi:PspC domain-containing protein [Goekera deserti]|nr:PspC domain-containing protein [Goekera deserti]
MTATALPGAPDHAPDAGRPPLRRSADDRVLGGVCAGLGAHTGLDPLLWRTALLALTLAGGAGILLYAVLWLLMQPAVAPVAPSAPERFAARVRRLVRS